MILAGDIGGTKTNLALYDYSEGILVSTANEQFASGDYDNFEEIINSFTEKHPTKIDALCLGIAGPVINGECKTTNLPWYINAKNLQEALHVTDVYLLNDLEATAYGMLYLKDDQFIELNPAAQSVDANCAVIAAGTGLGEAILYYDGSKYHPLGSEGGHCDFAPINSLQDELLQWLRKRHPEHVSLERILSGVGIATLYDFLVEKKATKESPKILNINQYEDRNALISRYALENKDPFAIKALEIFTEIYGAEAGNIALKSLALGGVYIGGGIAPKILPFLQDGRFLSAFVSKGRFKKMLEKVSIKVSLNQETALEGAAHYALDKISN